MKTTFKVLHLDCASCALVMEGIMEDTAGVKKAEVNSSKRILTVEHDDAVTVADLAKALDTEGYPVETVA